MTKTSETLRTRPGKNKRRELTQKVWRNKTFYLMFLPVFILLFLFSYMPMYGIVLAFKHYNPYQGIFGSDWAGMENFSQVFSNHYFWRAFRNTVRLNVLKLIFAFPAPILLAVMLNSIGRSQVRKTVQTIVYLPHFISWVVISSIVFALLDSDSGALAKFFVFLGLPKNLLGNGKFFIGLLVVSEIWKEVGWNAIIYLAALSGISPEYYEAAEIDGANKLQQFRFVTLPCLLPTISIMLILQVGGLVGGGFDQVYNLYNVLVYEDVDILDTFIYRYGIGEGQFSIGTAIGLFCNVINVCLLLVVNWIVKRMGGEALY